MRTFLIFLFASFALYITANAQESEDTFPRDSRYVATRFYQHTLNGDSISQRLTIWLSIDRSGRPVLIEEYYNYSTNRLEVSISFLEDTSRIIQYVTENVESPKAVNLGEEEKKYSATRMYEWRLSEKDYTDATVYVELRNIQRYTDEYDAIVKEDGESVWGDDIPFTNTTYHLERHKAGRDLTDEEFDRLNQR